MAGTSVVDGHVPTGAEEVGLGARTADDLGVGVGDEVTIGSPYGEHEVEVSGIVVLPTVGPLESDSTSVGTGALLPAPLLEATYDGAEEATGMTAVELADVSAALVVVDLAPGVDPQAFVDDLGEGIRSGTAAGASTASTPSPSARRPSSTWLPCGGCLPCWPGSSAWPWSAPSSPG